MLMLLLMALLLQGGGRIVTTAQSAPAGDLRPADPEPDAVTRGQSTVVTVRGTNLDALKTLTIEPAAGIRLGAIEPLPGRPDGSHAVRVTITVDADAAQGDRDIMLVTSPTMVMAPRAGDPNDETAKRMEEIRQAIMARETRPMTAGLIHINGHDVKVSRASFVRSGASIRASVIVEDGQGDVGDRAMPPAVVSGGGGGFTLVPVSDPLTVEARCAGGEPVDLLPDDVKVEPRQGASTTVTATFDAEDLAGQSNCELRVRAEDAEGNLSAWFVTQLSGR